MNAKRWLTVVSALGISLAVCNVAYANSLSPYVYFWPGIISITVAYAFPASLLAAFLERPFLSAAGIRRRPLILSLRANFVSTVAGLLLIPVGYPALLTIGPLWCVVAFGVSCAVEIYYLRRYSHQAFTSGWLLGGNAVSSVVLMALPPVAIIIRQNNLQLVWSLEPYLRWLALLTLIVSLTLFLGSFVWPVAAKSETTPPDSKSSASTSAGKAG